MKRIILLILVIMPVLFSSCGVNNEKKQPQDESKEIVDNSIENKESSAEVVTDESEPKTGDKDKKDFSEEDILFASLLPETGDHFKSKDINIIDKDGGKAYAFRVNGYLDEEYLSYIQACKDMGFSDVSYEGENETGKIFYAYDADKKFYLQVVTIKEVEAVDVICKLVKNK